MTDPADLRAELGPTETMAAWHRYLRWAVSYGLPGDGKRYVGMAWTCAAPGLPHPTPGVGHSAPWSPSRPKRVPIRDLRCRALTHAKLDDIGVPRFDDITESGWVPVGVYSPPAQPCEVCGRACVVTVDDRRVHPTCAREASGLTA